MEPFHSVTGPAAPLLSPNIDTDIIMPKTFLKGVDRKGLEVGTFNGLRFNGTKANREFILNKSGYEGCRFLVVGPNFGCGSSREHAVWGLCQLGIRALIGTTFAGIFNDNCKNNGLLTIGLPAEIVAMLAHYAGDPSSNTFTVDLEDQKITVDDTAEEVAFDIEPARKEMLLKGLDPIGMTLEFANDIRSFEARHKQRQPWFF